MRLIPSDPDVQTLVLRIENGDIDLQPDFQRGEIWSLAKRQKLIDSILRNWHVPPVHVILEDGEQRTSVLDGQQRLAAIRDFVRGSIAIDGNIKPFDESIVRLDGKRFNDLPHDTRRKFMQFPVRLFTISDYDAAEPGELFYRLNQPASLTAAEQRNAFFGVARRQVKELVGIAERLGLNESIFGFSNARMAYDDVITRVLFLLDANTLREKITSSALADKYRSGDAFNEQSVRMATAAMDVLEAMQAKTNGRMRFNKATAQSWLLFVAVAEHYAPKVLASAMDDDFIFHFEEARQQAIKGKGKMIFDHFSTGLRRSFVAEVLYTYENRSTARVADVSSVVLRDIAIWIFFISFVLGRGGRLPKFGPDKEALKKMMMHEQGVLGHASLEWLADDLDWGTHL